jgi:hypothetical protein
MNRSALEPGRREEKRLEADVGRPGDPDEKRTRMKALTDR